MKTITFTIMTIIALAAIPATAHQPFAAAETVKSTVGDTLKIVNDTDADVQIHTGSGFVEINKTSSTSVSCEAGKVISLAEKGKKKGELFTIDSSMCGKVVKLSKYM